MVSHGKFLLQNGSLQMTAQGKSKHALKYQYLHVLIGETILLGISQCHPQFSMYCIKFNNHSLDQL